MIKNVTIVIACILLLTCCKESTEPDPLQSKELQWKDGDFQVYHIERYTDPDTSYYDTSYVQVASIIDGYYTIYWTNPGRQARVRDGFYEIRYDYDDTWSGWMPLAKLPAVIGELLYTDEYKRTAADGSTRNTILLETRTSSTDTTITVPAGTFRCMASTSVEFKLPDRTAIDGFEQRAWYAPGIGYVQIEVYAVTIAGGRSLELRDRAQLYSY